MEDAACDEQDGCPAIGKSIASASVVPAEAECSAEATATPAPTTAGLSVISPSGTSSPASNDGISAASSGQLLSVSTGASDKDLLSPSPPMDANSSRDSPLFALPMKRPAADGADCEPPTKKPSAQWQSLDTVEDVSSDDDADGCHAASSTGKELAEPFSPISSSSDGKLSPQPMDNDSTTAAKCPVAHGGSPRDAATATPKASGDGAPNVICKSGLFIREEVVLNDPWREETEGHAKIAPVKYCTESIVPAHNKEHELPLPMNWLQIDHMSGAPVYMDRTTRVCTWSRPYYLGPHSAKKHDVPVCAIPCLAQGLVTGKAKNIVVNFPDAELVETVKKAESEAQAANSKDGPRPPLPPGLPDNMDSVVATVPTVKQEGLSKYFGCRWEMENLESHCFCRYCRKALEKGGVEDGDKSGSDEDVTEANVAAQKRANSLAMGEVQADGSMFFRIGRKGGTQLNTAGKTALSLLNEYCQRILRIRPEYNTSETNDPKNPFQVTVTLNDIRYGVGLGSNKKDAKQAAARQTLHAINPVVAKRLEDSKTRQAGDLDETFEDMPVDDPGIPQLCVELGMPRPSQVLAECLRRNQNSKPMDCDLKVEMLANRSCRYKMTCGEHIVEGKCVSKKFGRQTASQAMLKLLHPHTFTWASLMSLYCDKNGFNISQQPNDDQEDAEMTEILQHQQRRKDDVNQDVLTELRRRMKKLIPSSDSGRPLDASKVRRTHDFKISSSHPTQAPVPVPQHTLTAHGASPGTSRRASSEMDSRSPAGRPRSPAHDRERDRDRDRDRDGRRYDRGRHSSR